MPCSASSSTRQYSALLDVLDGLHGGSATHRDLTPMNIFVCGRGTLKLGDFGIARHELAGKPMTIDAFNPAFVTRGFVEDEHRHWMAVDDVFQMGQLLTMLISGKTERTIAVKEVAALPCDDELKGIIKRAIGPRKRRYPDAFEMLQALRGDKSPTAAKLRSLQDKQIVFTGPMTTKRFDAQVLALHGRRLPNDDFIAKAYLSLGRCQYLEGHLADAEQTFSTLGTRSALPAGLELVASSWTQRVRWRVSP